MDTILYIYKKRDLTQPVIESVQMKDYQLVRVGLNVGENRWFSHAFAPTVLSGTDAEGQSTRDDDGRRKRAVDGMQSERKDLRPVDFLRAHLHRLRERRGRIRTQKQEERQFQQIREQVRVEIESFLTQLQTCVDDRYECRCVYANAVRKCLVLPESRDISHSEADLRSEVDFTAAHWLQLLWKQFWRFPEFDDFLRPQWSEPLLEHARLHHFVALGSAGSTSTVILRCAHRMKSLRWFLEERECGQEVQDFVEEFYGEYGLAVALHPLEGERVFARLLLETREPVCVLDFTGEPRIPAGGLAKGSVWLDFCSIEEKARRITEREEGITYFSLKEIWKRAGKP